MSSTFGLAYVKVPVLSKTIVLASEMASINFPPLTEILCFPASLIAERTATGIESFKAQEKSTIKKAKALVTFLVSR